MSSADRVIYPVDEFEYPNSEIMSELHENIGVELLKCNGQNPLEVLLLSESFKERLLEGLKIAENRQESGFMAFYKINTDELILTRYVLGTQLSESGAEINLHAGIPDVIEDDQVHIRIAEFHYHPIVAGFSQTDIEHWDNTLFDQHYPSAHNDMIILAVPTVDKTVKPVTTSRRGKANSTLRFSGVTLLAIQRTPTASNRYQATDFLVVNGLTQQYNLFTQDGFKTWLVTLGVQYDNKTGYVINQDSSEKLAQTIKTQPPYPIYNS
jgi:hypothetical protein